MKEKHVKYILRTFFGIIILLGLFFGLTTLLEKWSRRKLSPAMQVSYIEWMRDPVNISVGDLEIEPFSDETVRNVRELMKIWEKHYDKALHLEDTISSEVYHFPEVTSLPEWPEVIDKIGEMDELTSSFISLVNRPDYEIEVLSEMVWETGNPYRSDAPKFLMLQINGKMLRFQAWEQIRRGNYEEASEISENLIDAGKTHKYSTLVTRLISIYLVNMGVETWDDVVEQCDDPVLLKKSLDMLKRHFPREPVITDNINIGVSDQLGLIRLYKRVGVEAPDDMEQHTGREIYGLAFKMGADYKENHLLPSVRDPGTKQNIESMIETDRAGAVELGARPESIKEFLLSLISRPAAPILYKIGMPNEKEANTRDDTATVKGNILLLETALKLYRLEKGHEPENIDVVVEEYLEEKPEDPFSQKKKSLKFKDGTIYSIGPDKIDQGAKLKYDPTNGTISPGDIFFR